MTTKRKDKYWAVAIQIPEQKKLCTKYCFKECGKILFGGLIDPTLGALAPCKEKVCRFSKKQTVYLGEFNTGEFEVGDVYLRCLKSL